MRTSASSAARTARSLRRYLPLVARHIDIEQDEIGQGAVGSASACSKNSSAFSPSTATWISAATPIAADALVKRSDGAGPTSGPCHASCAIEPKLPPVTIQRSAKGNEFSLYLIAAFGAVQFRQKAADGGIAIFDGE